MEIVFYLYIILAIAWVLFTSKRILRLPFYSTPHSLLIISAIINFLFFPICFFVWIGVVLARELPEIFD